MLARLVTAAAVAMGFVCPAHAETRRFAFSEPVRVDDEAIVIGTPTEQVTVERVHAAVASADGITHARLTIELSTPARRPVSSELSLTVPAGSRVTNLALTLGRKEEPLD